MSDAPALPVQAPPNGVPHPSREIPIVGVTEDHCEAKHGRERNRTLMLLASVVAVCSAVSVFLDSGLSRRVEAQERETAQLRQSGQQTALDVVRANTILEGLARKQDVDVPPRVVVDGGTTP